MEQINQILNLSPPAILVIVLMTVGRVVKTTPINNKWIPAILVAIGGAAWPFVGKASNLNFEADVNPTAFLVLQGIAFGGVATAFHQIGKQFLGGKKKSETKI